MLNETREKLSTAKSVLTCVNLMRFSKEPYCLYLLSPEFRQVKPRVAEMLARQSLLDCDWRGQGNDCSTKQETPAL